MFEVLSTSGDTHLGGDDFDKRCAGGRDAPSRCPAFCPAAPLPRNHHQPPLSVPTSAPLRSPCSIVDWLAEDFQAAEGMDLRKDRQALQVRVGGAARAEGRPQGRPAAAAGRGRRRRRRRSPRRPLADPPPLASPPRPAPPRSA